MTDSGCLPTLMFSAEKVRIEPKAVIATLRCERTQHENCRKCPVWRAAVRLQTRPFEHRAARFVLAIHRSRMGWMTSAPDCRAMRHIGKVIFC